MIFTFICISAVASRKIGILGRQAIERTVEFGWDMENVRYIYYYFCRKIGKTFPKNYFFFAKKKEIFGQIVVNNPNFEYKSTQNRAKKLQIKLFHKIKFQIVLKNW